MSRSLEIDRLDIPVRGGTLAAFRLGTAPSDAPVAVAVHGITGNSHTWVAVARALGGHANLIAVDLRGRGRSSGLPAPYGIGVHVGDLLAVLDHLGLPRAVVAGHSLGAYLTARLAADHPDRLDAALLVDGGLPIPGTEDVDPQTFLDAFLGPAVARLKMTFADRQAYRDWWRAHPAFAGGDVHERDLHAYADHDLVGEPPAMHSCISQESVRADAAGLVDAAEAAYRMRTPATLLCAPRGLLDDPNPMQPLAVARQWADAAPDRRRAELIEGTNHYTITLGPSGARALADQLVAITGSVVDRAPPLP